MSKYALIVIDIQEGIMDFKPYNQERFIKNVNQLVAAARKKDIEVIWVMHTEANSNLDLNQPGHQIYHELNPLPEEKRIHKYHNSIFKETILKKYLDDKRIDTLILCGMQTEWCVDKSITVAFEFGYQLIVPQELHTTMDMDVMTGESLYQYYQNYVFPAFVESKTLAETIQKL